MFTLLQRPGFYQSIKAACPEIIFHGTDVGHQYQATGARYLSLLEEQGLRESERYRLTEQAIEQGERYYAQNDQGYRENRMVENFIREFDNLAGEDVMGIYGTAHTAVGAMAQGSKTVPSMAGQLHERYDEALHVEDLRELTKPFRMDNIELGGKTYQAAYWGRQELCRRRSFLKRRKNSENTKRRCLANGFGNKERGYFALRTGQAFQRETFAYIS